MSEDAWGEMVIPGVYMIKRQRVFTEISGDSDDKAYTNPELLHHDLKELEKLVQKLKESNCEIAAYLSDPNREREDEGRRLASLSGEACDEDEEFRAAIAENEQIIREKEKEIKRLQALISLQHCGANLYEAPKNPDSHAVAPVSGISNEEDPEVIEEEIESPIHIDL